MTFSFSKASLAHLVGVHPDLVKVMTAALAISPVDFGIIEGVRSLARQAELFTAKKSQTMNSRHLEGFAVDFMAYVDGVGTWEDKYYAEIAAAVKKAAFDLGVPIAWGGDWVTFKDMDHIELDHVAYPDKGKLVA